jgi:type VI secretion system secreted protein Hcp
MFPQLNTGGMLAMKKISWVVGFAMLLGTAAWAQNGQAQAREFQKRSTITVTLQWSGNTSCTTSVGPNAFPALTWTFGAKETVSSGGTGSGGGAGKTTFANLIVTKRTDSCSPALFSAVAKGEHIPKVTVVQQDNNKDDVVSVVLENVFIESYQLSGDISQEVPVETISFNFGAIAITDSISGAKFGWNLKANHAF